MLIRIIGGHLKGHPIKIPARKSLRPSMGKIRKAIFDILGPSIEDSFFLDLFSGTGAIGIEALSRGAKTVYFVEKDRISAKHILKNLETYHLQLQSKVWVCDVFSALKKLLKQQIQFTHIFMDAPYNLYSQSKPYFLSIIHILDKSEILKLNGILFIEDQGKIDYKQICKTLTLITSKKFGGTFLHKFTK